MKVALALLAFVAFTSMQESPPVTGKARMMEPEKTPVGVVWTGEDAVGRLLADQLREAVGRAALFQAIDGDSARNRISIASVESGDPESSAISVMYEVLGVCQYPSEPKRRIVMFVKHSAHYVGRSRTETSAQGVLTDFSEYLSRLQRDAVNAHCQFEKTARPPTTAGVEG
jgi:hypothetical protein